MPARHYCRSALEVRQTAVGGLKQILDGVFEDGVGDRQGVGKADLDGIAVSELLDQPICPGRRDVEGNQSKRFVGSCSPSEAGRLSRSGHRDPARTSLGLRHHRSMPLATSASPDISIGIV